MSEQKIPAQESHEASAFEAVRESPTEGRDESTPQAQMQESPPSDTEGVSEEAQKAREVEEAHERADQKMKELEEDPPEKLEDWPTDEAKYSTFGGSEGDHSYEEGPERKLGPSEVRHHEDGSVTVSGEPVDNPEDYKGDPIPGGPTDPDAPTLSGEGGSDESDEGRQGSRGSEPA
jgi:hypothetical protein